MLYVFYGSDIAQAGTKARSLVESLRTKRPDAAYEKMDADSWNKNAIEGHLGGQGLFSSKYIIFLDRVAEKAIGKEELPDIVEAMQESPNVFIILEQKPNAELKKVLEKYAEKIVVADKADKTEGKEGFNIFALTGSIGTDPVKAWTMYRKAIEDGMEPEAVVGVLFWKAKTSGMKRFARELIVAYHDAHRGLCDLELAAEKCILNSAR